MRYKSRISQVLLQLYKSFITRAHAILDKVGLVAGLHLIHGKIFVPRFIMPLSWDKRLCKKYKTYPSCSWVRRTSKHGSSIFICFFKQNNVISGMQWPCFNRNNLVIVSVLHRAGSKECHSLWRKTLLPPRCKT